MATSGSYEEKGQRSRSQRPSMRGDEQRGQFSSIVVKSAGPHIRVGRGAQRAGLFISMRTGAGRLAVPAPGYQGLGIGALFEGVGDTTEDGCLLDLGPLDVIVKGLEL